MKEWNDPINPFNSMKVLLWRKHLEACANGNYLTPVTVDIDPSNLCNYNCEFCNAYDMMNQNNVMKMIPESHLLSIADFLYDWGCYTEEGSPKSACVAGGGEPLTNNGTMAFLERMKLREKETGLITNGSLLNDEKIDIVAKNCRWVGFSMDAATNKTYMKVKGISNEDIFFKVIENIKKLTCKINGLDLNNDVAFKFLLYPENAHEILDAVILAKELGVKDFHLRPVGWINLTKTKDKEISFIDYEDIINRQLEEAAKLETPYFKVYGIRHKFNMDFSPKKNFYKCRAIPLLPTFGADGYLHCCFDMRGREDLKMCSHFPDPYQILKFWNSEEHHRIVDSINIYDCPRCTFTTYNEIIENVIIEDRMCRNFP